uniref:AlNc14C3G424 protein n=1 Tax=Albugo laibachii Nc14 TaxID=890382 RepID=F0VZU5_9STRA|nr:AlNc14C3G424 [Albugo laibachii Nc14]|eukprot:CCA14316.1 AlNc14C3G424 [Albugo laibachii Nc14]
MKAFLLKAYGVTMVGVFYSHDHLMSAIQVPLIPASSTKSELSKMLQTGLKAQISPAVVFLDDGSPIETEVHETKWFQVTLVLGNHPEPDEKIFWQSANPTSSNNLQEAYGFADLEVNEHFLFECARGTYSIGWKLN